MSTVYNPEADRIADVERLEMQCRNLRRQVERSMNAEDRRILNRQLADAIAEIEFLRKQLPH
jgi:hypothetical protein